MANSGGRDVLSARELQIARAYSSGETFRQIAERLNLAPSTVRTHLQTVYRKLEVSSKIALLRAIEDDSGGHSDETPGGDAALTAARKNASQDTVPRIHLAGFTGTGDEEVALAADLA